MARTRERNFVQLIRRFTQNINSQTVPRPDLADIEESGFLDQITLIYRNLGGILSKPPSRIGNYDFIIDGRAIELDEEAHFNRYRKITLASNIYQENSFFNVDDYFDYCQRFESDCLRGRSFGGYWTNDSAEKQFGEAGPNGDLSGNGSPRWKQRAFYDFLKDLTPLIYEIPVIRISIYDTLTNNNGISITINEILENLNNNWGELLYQRITL